MALGNERLARGARRSIEICSAHGVRVEGAESFLADATAAGYSGETDMLIYDKAKSAGRVAEIQTLVRCKLTYYFLVLSRISNHFVLS